MSVISSCTYNITKLDEIISSSCIQGNSCPTQLCNNLPNVINGSQVVQTLLCPEQYYCKTPGLINSCPRFHFCSPGTVTPRECIFPTFSCSEELLAAPNKNQTIVILGVIGVLIYTALSLLLPYSLILCKELFVVYNASKLLANGKEKRNFDSMMKIPSSEQFRSNIDDDNDYSNSTQQPQCDCAILNRCHTEQLEVIDQLNIYRITNKNSTSSIPVQLRHRHSTTRDNDNNNNNNSKDVSTSTTTTTYTPHQTLYAPCLGCGVIKRMNVYSSIGSLYQHHHHYQQQQQEERRLPSLNSFNNSDGINIKSIDKKNDANSLSISIQPKRNRYPLFTRDDPSDNNKNNNNYSDMNKNNNNNNNNSVNNRSSSFNNTSNFTIKSANTITKESTWNILTSHAELKRCNNNRTNINNNKEKFNAKTVKKDVAAYQPIPSASASSSSSLIERMKKMYTNSHLFRSTAPSQVQDDNNNVTNDNSNSNNNNNEITRNASSSSALTTDSQTDIHANLKDDSVTTKNTSISSASVTSNDGDDDTNFSYRIISKPIHVEFQNLTMQLRGAGSSHRSRNSNNSDSKSSKGDNKSSKNKKATITKSGLILRNISGEIRPHRITGLMGPSGAGKTSLLSLLRGQAYYASVTGSIKVNKRAYKDLSSFRDMIAYVPQDDIMYDELTVQENIMFSAVLFNKRHYHATWQVMPMVKHTIELLSLRHISSSIVGSAEKKGISGGQRKRVSIAMEMVKEAVLFLLDEPTSGLDSASSISLLTTLHILSEIGVTIVATLHQPRKEILDLIDDMILLAPGGRMVYYGPTSGLESHFSRGLGYTVKPGSNIADFVMDVMAGFVVQDTINFISATDTINAITLFEKAIGESSSNSSSNNNIDCNDGDESKVGGTKDKNINYGGGDEFCVNLDDVNYNSSNTSSNNNIDNNSNNNLTFASNDNISNSNSNSELDTLPSQLRHQQQSRQSPPMLRDVYVIVKEICDYWDDNNNNNNNKATALFKTRDNSDDNRNDSSVIDYNNDNDEKLHDIYNNNDDIYITNDNGGFPDECNLDSLYYTPPKQSFTVIATSLLTRFLSYSLTLLQNYCLLFLRTYFIIFLRQLYLFTRNLGTFTGDVFTLYIIGGIIALLYPTLILQSFMNSITTQVLSMQLSFCLLVSTAATRLFSLDAIIRNREIESGLMILPYYLGKYVGSCVEIFIFPAIFLCTYYSLAVPASTFQEYYFLLVLLQLVIYGLANVVSVMISPKSRVLVLNGFIIITWAFGGLQPNIDSLITSMGQFGQFMNTVSPFRYTYKINVYQEFFQYPTVFFDKTLSLQLLSFSYGNFTTIEDFHHQVPILKEDNIAILLWYTFITNIIAVVYLYYSKDHFRLYRSIIFLIQDGIVLPIVQLISNVVSVVVSIMLPRKKSPLSS